jgi:hypothetical protein
MTTFNYNFKPILCRDLGRTFNPTVHPEVVFSMFLAVNLVFMHLFQVLICEYECLTLRVRSTNCYYSRIISRLFGYIQCALSANHNILIMDTSTKPFNSGSNPWSSYMIDIYSGRHGPQPLGTVSFEEIEAKAREKLKDYGGAFAVI